MRMWVWLLGATLLLQGCHGRDPAHPRHRGPTPTMAGEDKAYWNTEAQATLAQRVGVMPQLTQAKNIVFFLGDGMSVSTVTAARILKGQSTGLWEREQLLWEAFPYTALLKAYCTDTQVADSACSVTAYLGGVKGNRGTIGVDQNVLRGNCSGQDNPAFQVDSIAKKFVDGGKSAGLVTTTRVTHATPAGMYANIAERDWESDYDVWVEGEDPAVCIDGAQQLVLGHPGRSLKVIMGGGRVNLTPNDTMDVEVNRTGARLDGQDLIQTWLQQKDALGANASYVWNRDDLLAVDTANTDYLMGLFAYDHMDYLVERDPVMDPSLPEMTRAALQVLQRDPNGFFLLVEGGQIDRGHHGNWAKKALTETVEFDEAVGVALQMTDPQDTLVLVTADHSHSMSISGDPMRHTDILGIGDYSDVDGMPYLTVLYGIGPGYEIQFGGHRPNITDDNFMGNFYRHGATAPRVSAAHGGDDIGLWATGPHSHLFTGVYEQNYVAHAMAYAACVGQDLTFCSSTLH